MFVIIGDNNNILTAYLSGKGEVGKTPIEHCSRANDSVYDAKKSQIQPNLVRHL